MDDKYFEYCGKQFANLDDGFKLKQLQLAIEQLRHELKQAQPFTTLQYALENAIKLLSAYHFDIQAWRFLESAREQQEKDNE